MPKLPRISRLTRSTPVLLLLALLNKATGQYIPPQALGMRRWGGADTHDAVGVGMRDGEGKMDRRDDDTQSSTSVSMYLVSHTDFCVFGPSDAASTNLSDSSVNVVSWCTDARHGNRLIPDGTLKGVTYVKASSWVQVSGTGDFTNINIASGDEGAQYDSDSNTPDGAMMYVTDDNESASSWITMISADTFCVRACTDATYCPTDYDEMGCYFYTSYGVGWDDVYQDCEADDGDPPGVVDGTTYTQGDSPTPTPSTPAVSNCQVGASVTTVDSSATSTGASSDSDSGDSDSSGDSSSSTSWVPVETCAPCTDTVSGSSSSASSSATAISGSSAASSGSSNSSGGETEQVGVTQVSSAASSGSGVAAAQTSNSVSTASSNGSLTSAASSGSGSQTTSVASSSTTSAASGGENGGTETEDDLTARRWLYQRDDSGTTTSNGQCCYTTWTPSVVGAQATGSSSSSSSSRSVALSGTLTASGSTSTSAKSSSTSGRGELGSSTSTSATVSGTSKSSNTTASSSDETSTNSTNETSGGVGRVVLDGVGMGIGSLGVTLGASGLLTLLCGLVVV